MRSAIRRALGVLALATCCAAAPAPAVAQTQPTLDGASLQTWRGADDPRSAPTVSDIQCDADGTSSFRFSAEGIAYGSLPGTFTTAGTVTIGPQGGVPVNGPVLTLEATFTIDSPAGTVEGTQHLIATSTSNLPFGDCFSDFPHPQWPYDAGALIVHFYADYDSVRYEATITTADGTTVESGRSGMSLSWFYGTCTGGMQTGPGCGWPGGAYDAIFDADEPPAPPSIFDLIAQSGLTSGVQNSLLAKIEHAVAAYADGNANAACGSLGAFVNQIDALVSAGHLSEQQGAALLAPVSSAQGQICSPAAAAASRARGTRAAPSPLFARGRG